MLRPVNDELRDPKVSRKRKGDLNYVLNSAADLVTLLVQVKVGAFRTPVPEGTLIWYPNGTKTRASDNVIPFEKKGAPRARRKG